MNGPIDVPALIADVGDPGCGGLVLFLGTVRRTPDDGPVVAIEYSAYHDMAEEEIERIVTEAQGRWPTVRCEMRHRVGEVPLGEASIAVAAAAPHRPEAFDAARWIIDQAKRRLPVWKKERSADGSTSWRENERGPDSGADRAAS